MSELEKLEKKLYGKNEEELSRRMRRRIVFPGSIRKIASVWREEDAPASSAAAGNPSKARIFKIVFAASGVIFLLLTVGFLLLYFGTRGEEARITIQSRGPIEAGELITVPIIFENTSRTTLKEVELSILLPRGSIVEEGGFEKPASLRLAMKLQDLRPSAEGGTEVVVRMFGREGEEKEIQAILSYRPEKLRARFSSKASKLFLIHRVPLGVAIEAPATVSRGQEIEAIVRYTSTAARPFEELSLRLEYPSGFTFTTGDPKPELGDTIWSIGTINPAKEGTIRIRGKISGEEGEVKSFRAELGILDRLTKEWTSYRDTSMTMKIGVTPLSVSATMNNLREGAIAPGTRVEGVIRYKNNTASDLKNITIRAVLEGGLFNLSSLSVEQGTFDQTSRAIVWAGTAKPELRELASGVEGEARFTVETRDRPVIQSESDKNQTIQLQAEILPSLIPEELQGTDLSSRDKVELKVKTRVIFSGRSLFRSSPILNSGPLPPKVGERTKYAVLFEARNFTNDLDSAEVSAFIPPNVKWEGNFLPSDARVTFDEASREIRWRVGRLEAGTGVISPALTLAFQISVVPADSDAGKPMMLVGESSIKGKDAFAGEDIIEVLGPLTTELLEDPAANSQEWSVVR